MMTDFKRLDGIINVAYTNIFTLGKTTKKIVFLNFNPKDEGHLALYFIAVGATNIFNIEIRYNFSFWKFLWFKIKHKEVKRYRGKKDGIYNICFKDVDDFIGYIENANNEKGVFKKIYNEYFKRSKK